MKHETGNPYQPGAGHLPPYLAGRQKERDEYRRLLNQGKILENAIITGIRGIGKTSLLRDLKTDAVEQGWLWVENDMSESASVSEQNLLTRILADLGVKIGDITVAEETIRDIGFDAPPETRQIKADYHFLNSVAENTPGLMSDKLKAVLALVWQILLQARGGDKRGIVFAYDEAQNISDHANRKEYPLAMLLDVFSSLQSQGIPYMLVLTGLPPLFSKLVEARTFSERMFRVIRLDKLKEQDARDAILKPLNSETSIYHVFQKITDMKIVYDFTQGYPYFIQYWCKELYDYYHTTPKHSEEDIIERIQIKLDADFFDGRWEQLTDRERDLLRVIAVLLIADDKEAATVRQREFTVQQIKNFSQENEAIKKFSGSITNQVLTRLNEKGMVFKSRHGKYLLAVPLLANYIKRQHSR